jgi:hypothetical protein
MVIEGRVKQVERFKSHFPHRKLLKEKMAGDLHRTAQPPTLATFRSWGSSAGAGRVRPAGAKIREKYKLTVDS